MSIPTAPTRRRSGLMERNPSGLYQARIRRRRRWRYKARLEPSLPISASCKGSLFQRVDSDSRHIRRLCVTQTTQHGPSRTIPYERRAIPGVAPQKTDDQPHREEMAAIHFCSSFLNQIIHNQPLPLDRDSQKWEEKPICTHRSKCNNIPRTGTNCL